MLGMMLITSAVDITADKDGGCIVAGNLMLVNTMPVLLKFSPSGKLIWGKRFDFYPNPGYIYSIDTTNGGYIASGLQNNSLVFKINNEGDILWANSYNIPYNDNHHYRHLLTDKNGNIVFAGPEYYDDADSVHNGYIVKLDSTGNLLFFKRCEDSVTLKDVALSSNGYYAVGFTNTDGFPSDLYVIKTNTAGNITGNCTPTTTYNIIKTIAQDSVASNQPLKIFDDTLTATNITLNVVHYDTLPQNLCGITQGLVNETEDQAALAKLSVSPNPTHGVFTVTYNSNNAGKVQLNVYDKTGKLMFTKTEQAVKGNNSYQLNVSNLINGVYNLQLINGSEQQQVKIVVEK